MRAAYDFLPLSDEGVVKKLWSKVIGRCCGQFMSTTLSELNMKAIESR